MAYTFDENTQNENRAWNLGAPTHTSTKSSTTICFYDFAEKYGMTFSGYDNEMPKSSFAESLGK